MAKSKSSSNFLSQWHPKHSVTYLSGLKSTYGTPFFLMMISVYTGVKGAVHFFMVFLQLPYYQSIGHDGAVQQEMLAISFVPWSCKGFIGVVSDVLPLFGYKKTTYMYFYTIMGSICALATAILPSATAAAYPTIPAVLMFFIFLQTAAHDLLMEAKYAEQTNKIPGSKPNLVTFAWFCTVAGQLFPSVLVGTVSDVADPRILFYVVAVFAIQPVIFLMRGGLIDDKVSQYESNRLNVEMIKSQWKIMLLATALAVASLGTVFITVFTNSTFQVVYTAIIALLFVITGFLTLPNIIARYNIYNFLGTSFYVNLQGALDYYYTESEDCVPNGPEFSYKILKTYATILSTFAQFLGMIIFQVVMTKWKFRSVFFITTVFRIAASVSDIILVQRWNLLIGIPDVVFYMLGYAIIYQVTYMMDFIPGIILITRLCSKNLEATMFALLAGYGNFGINASNLIGVFLMDMFGIKTKITAEGGCNWDNMVYLILIGHGLMPGITLIVIWLVIPNVHMNDSLVETRAEIEAQNMKKSISTAG